MKQWTIAVVSLALCQRANAQSLNIDIDIGFGGYEAGAGAPSSTFGGAADQAGYWNRIRDSGGVDLHTLRNLDGTTSSATIQYYQSGPLAGSGWNGNDGEHRLLMNDGVEITVPATFNFANLEPGRYQVFTYFADRSGRDVPGDVTIFGADTETKVSGVGGMPGNEFIEGRTHAVHDVTLTTSSISILVRTNPEGPPDSTLSGFQIVQVSVPESSGLVVVAAGWLGLLRFVRKTKPL
ncbi:MAG TPA: hypothetical protein PKA27_12525 [Fimbriimonadaceae bacterium]|nr:hypothetical protein [Fimbriimonadaceae bacterium]